MNHRSDSQKTSEDKPVGATNGEHAVAPSPPLLAQNYSRVLEQIASACQKVGRDRQSVTLVAVSKTQSAQAVMALATCGQREFGENYLQEALDKIVACRQQAQNLGAPPLLWHFIGPIQSNKTRPIAEQFDWVDSVERLKIAQRLNEQRPPHLPALNVCIQVNISEESSKSGTNLEEAGQLAIQIASLERLRLRGLMTIPAPAGTSPLTPKECFEQLAALHQRIRHQLAPAQQAGFDTLSMGMSADLNDAIAAGATTVRIGTALFGQRQP